MSLAPPTDRFLGVRRRAALAVLASACLAPPARAQEPIDPDTDGDGLSDHQEAHKYLTDPHHRDSDGDGIPDGGWDERTEYTYVVRSVLHVLKPCNVAAMTDDYQDARLLCDLGDAVEVEVIHYPFNTNAEAMAADPEFRRHAEEWEEYLRSGPTSNWDAEMQAELRRKLREDGIDVDTLTDRELVNAVSGWLMQHATYEDGFTTFLMEFDENGVAYVPDSMQGHFEAELRRKDRTALEQWNRELYGKGMFETAARGSCTSSAIYIQTCLRAVGIPTRTIICTPVVDASDPREVELVRTRISHHQVREILMDSVARLGRSWASHTYNEVRVGERWRRLNYSYLGQNTLDRQVLGLMTHVHTYRDHAEAGLHTWGRREQAPSFAALFGGSNPYSCISLSDRFGVHCALENPEPASAAPPPSTEPAELLTVEAATWLDDPSLPGWIQSLWPEEGAALLLRVTGSGADAEAVRRFTLFADKGFELACHGRQAVTGTAMEGALKLPGGGDQALTLFLDGDAFERLEPGVHYELRPRNGSPPYRFAIADGLTVTRR